MQKICSLTFVIASISIFSCNSQPKEVKTVNMPASEQQATPKFTAAMVDNLKDPSCGMPVSAGIEDTVHYKGKVIGFCSKECRDEFMKDPEKNIAAADLKK
jgi:YHS domain-containing protein